MEVPADILKIEKTSSAINICSVSKQTDINTKLTFVQPVDSVGGVNKQDMEIMSSQDKAKVADKQDMEIMSSQDRVKVADKHDMEIMSSQDKVKVADKHDMEIMSSQDKVKVADKQDMEILSSQDKDYQDMELLSTQEKVNVAKDQDNYRDQDELKHTLVNSQGDVRNGENDQCVAKHRQDEAKHDQDVANRGPDEAKHNQDVANQGHDNAKHVQDKAKHDQDEAKHGQGAAKHGQEGDESCHSGSTRSYTPISTSSSAKHTDDSTSMSSHSSDDFQRSPRIIRFNQNVMAARYEDLAQSTLPLKDYSGDNLRVFWRTSFRERVADIWASFKGLFTCCVRTKNKKAKKSADWECCGITTSVSTSRSAVGHETEISSRRLSY